MNVRSVGDSFFEGHIRTSSTGRLAGVNDLNTTPGGAIGTMELG